MKTIEISDELYDKLKTYVVDPFDDTPENVISRLLDIVDKARGKWTSWDAEEDDEQQNDQQKRSHKRPTKRGQSGQEQVGMLL
jgi:predicted CopG family antitoxin